MVFSDFPGNPAFHLGKGCRGFLLFFTHTGKNIGENNLYILQEKIICYMKIKTWDCFPFYHVDIM